MPDAVILIVDDIATNLDVAAGLLSPYEMRIDRVSGGLEALQSIQKNRYDLMLMDHMMPDMDGVEAAMAVRKLETNYFKRLPIIALTANAVSGMKEMFLEKGFNDYISKPIEIVKLDEAMARWIPPEKRIKTRNEIKRETFSDGSGLVIPGADVKKGINMTGGTEEGYRKVLTQFYKDIQTRLPLLDKPPEEPELPAFTAQVHAIKSAAGTIGAAELSAQAAELEEAGRAGDTAAIREKFPRFCEKLTVLAEGIKAALAPPAGTVHQGKGNSPALKEKVQQLKRTRRRRGCPFRLLQ